jgi:phosphohistidine phosphatase
VRAALPEPTPVWFERRLYGASAGELIERLDEVPDADGSALLVGHNPGLQDLVLDLAPSREAELVARVEAKFPTAAFATLDLAVDRWAEVQPGTGTLVAYVVPRDLE